MEVLIEQSAEKASRDAARVVADIIRKKPDAVLGLATGSTPLKLYAELIRMHREEGLDFSQVRTFNLDEYIGLSPDHKNSYHRFMWDHLFCQINIQPEHVHIPDGMADDVQAFCAAYEQAISEAGGIDVQVLGIGSDGHLGFNEPGSSLASRTRLKTLTKQTRADNARFFDGDISQVPVHCITMGIGTIMEAKVAVTLAFGEHKAEAVVATVEGAVSAFVPSSILQFHSAAQLYLDPGSASELKLADYYRWVLENKPDWKA